MKQSIQVRKELNEKKLYAKSILRKVELENRSEPTAEEQSDFDKAMQAIADLQKRLATLEGNEEAEAKLDEMETESRSLGRKVSYAQSEVHPEIKRYSLLRALRLQADRKPLDGLEGEIANELEKNRYNKSRGGFLMPMSLRVPTKYANTDTSTASGLVQTTVDTEQFIDALRNKLVLVKAGARFLSGLTGGPVALPRRSGTNTAAWVAEGSSPSASNTTGDQVVLTPATLISYNDISRKFMYQSSIDAEQLVRDDLIAVIARKIEQTALNGSGSGAEFTGLLQNSSVHTTALGTNGANPTWANMITLESYVAGQKAEQDGKMAYIVSPNVRGYLKGVAKAGSYPVFVYESNSINDCPAYMTQAMPDNLTKGTASGICGSVVYGCFDDLVIGQWGDSVEILVDPYTGSSSGTYRVNAYLDAAIATRHNESFAKIVDALTS